MILFGEKSLRHAVAEFMAHYHAERSHQGMGNILPFSDDRTGLTEGRIANFERLGVLLNFYHRKAA